MQSQLMEGELRESLINLSMNDDRLGLNAWHLRDKDLELP